MLTGRDNQVEGKAGEEADSALEPSFGLALRFVHSSTLMT